MDEKNKLIDLINNKAQMVAMLAPSFILNFNYPQIVTMLKKLGFAYVVEVSAGAKRTNEGVLAALQSNPNARFITSPCPSFVRLVRTKYPHLTRYLALTVDSPMIATAKIVKEKYPGFKPVFIGPCIVKKLEASEDYPQLDILVLTYQEISDVFKQFNIVEEPADSNITFDILEKSTRTYPTDGGLTFTSGVDKILQPEEYKIVSGWKNCEETLLEFDSNPKLRFADVLFCEGGCINGPATDKTLTIEQRKEKVKEFANRD
jgi:iron only hydrogenase large subunit-like protein